MLRPKHPFRRNEALARLTQQPGDNLIRHQRSRLPPIRLERRIQVGELRFQPSLSDLRHRILWVRTHPSSRPYVDFPSSSGLEALILNWPNLMV
jgi:hypothetical protein